MINYITSFFKMLLPILRSAAIQAIADEVNVLARRERHDKRMRSNSGYFRYDRITPRHMPPRSRLEATRNVGRAVREAREFDDNGIERYTENYNRVMNNPTRFHDVLMVAFDVTGKTDLQVHSTLMDLMPKGDSFYGDNEDVYLDSWWVANDQRFDGSDTDSAVFCKKGEQREAREMLRRNGLVE